MKRMLFGIFAMAVAAAQDEMDWTRLNIAAREHAKTPIRAGVPGMRPFWNAHAKAFIHPPAFEFQEVKGAKAYHFVLTAEQKGRTDGSPIRAFCSTAGSDYCSVTCTANTV